RRQHRPATAAASAPRPRHWRRQGATPAPASMPRSKRRPTSRRHTLMKHLLGAAAMDRLGQEVDLAAISGEQDLVARAVARRAARRRARPLDRLIEARQALAETAARVRAPARLLHA